MAIDTKIEGAPESIRSAAAWLRSTLAASVQDCVTDVYGVRSQSEWAWSGDSGAAFRARMTSGGQSADGMLEEYEKAAQSFDDYAGNLQTAQIQMGRARDVALEGGLQVTENEILEPGPAPTAPTALPSDGSATPQMMTTYNEAVQAQQAHARQVAAYSAAATDADAARKVVDTAKDFGSRYWNDLRSKSLFHAADLANKAVLGGYGAYRSSQLMAKADTLLLAKAALDKAYYNSNSSATRAQLTTQAQAAFDEADRAKVQASSVGRRIASKVPIIGLGVTAVGIGHEVHTGKPAGKAIISGVGGALAAAGTGAVIGTAIGGPAGTVIGAGAGLVVGVAAGVGLDMGYDALPEGVKEGIESGADSVGGAIGDAGGAVAGGAKKAWDSVF